MELSENTGIKKHAIELIEAKQSSYGFISAFILMELETLKIYIKTYLKTRFIWCFKTFVDTPILFDKKPDGSLYLHMDYQGLNNFTIKNQYLFILMSEVLNWLG